MSENEGSPLGRAALRVEWAARALTGAGEDLQAAGATAAGDVIADEAERVAALAAEVRGLAKVGVSSV